MKLKYIVTKNNNFAIFSETSNHNDIARGLDGIPAGAGFCTIGIDTPYLNALRGNNSISIHCYGQSISLKIKSRPEDEEIISNKINDKY